MSTKPLWSWCLLFTAVGAALVAGSARSQTPLPAESPEQRDARMAWWREARFGMFIHWGLYAVPAGRWNEAPVPGIGEWIQQRANIPREQYEQLATRFDPVKYDPGAWARLAAEAGVRYVIITAKHHDGFCLWETNATDWNVVDRTPYRRDLLGPLAEACRGEGIRFCVYYSIMDWHHPAQDKTGDDYNPSTMKPGRKQQYVDDMQVQLAELLAGCDPDVLWFDGEWCDWWTEEDGRQLYAYLRELKPALIINNRVGKGRDGMAGLNRGDGAYVGDYGTPEQEIPARGLPGVDWETCMTMNDTWGFKDDDHNWKSVETLVRQLVDSASKGGNYLLNVGPTAEGEIPAASIDRLQAIGRWMQANGEAIYGTTASPLEEFGWGRCTAKAGPGGATLYLHVLQWPADGRLVLPTIPGAIRAASLLANGEALAAMVDGDRWTIAVPREPLDPIDTVIKVELDAPLDRKHDATRR